MRGTLVVFLLLIWIRSIGQSAPSITSAGKYNIKQWTTLNGLAQNSIRDIEFDAQGTMWLASFGGLVRFDGTDFTHFNIGNSPELYSNRIINLFLDSHDSLWISYENIGMTVQRNQNFTRFGKGTELESLHYSNIVEDQSGKVWFSTSDGIKRLDAGMLTDLPIDSRFSNLGKMQAINNELFAVSSGIPGFVGQKAILIFNGEKVIKEYTVEIDGIWSFCKTNPEYLWVLFHDRMVKMDGFQLDTLLLPHALRTPHDLLELDNQMWIGTHYGLFRATPENNQINQWEEVIPNINVQSLKCDAEGNIWVGTEGNGLFLIDEREVTIWETDPVDSQPVTDVTNDGQGGIWFSTSCKHLIHYDGQNFDQNIFPERCVMTLHHDPYSNDVLVGSDHQVTRLSENGVDTLVTLFKKSYGHRITAIHVDNQKSIWVGTGSGTIYRQQDGQLKAFETMEGNLVYYITQLKSGEIWAGTTNGIYVISENSQKSFTQKDGIAPGAIRSIYEDEDGIIWVGSYGGGLTRIENGSITVINEKSGLSENIVSRILEDQHGRIWMLGNMGLFMTSRKMLNDYAAGDINQINCIFLNESDGMREGNGAGIGAISIDGKSWWPTINGIASIEINDFQVDSSNLRVNIHEVTANNKLLPIHNNMIELDRNQRDFEISFTAIHYNKPERVKYQHQLVGYDKDWVNDGNKHIVNYTNLPPGNYTLRIRAANPHNIWSNEIKELSIVIIPKWWEIVWIQMIGVMIIILLGILLIRAWNASLLNRKKILQQQVKMRTKQLEIKNQELENGHQQLEKTITELKQTQDQLIQSEKMASLGILAAGVAHEINNPLNFIRGGLYSIFALLSDKDQNLDPELIKYKETIDEGINRTSSIVRSLNQFSRSGESMKETCHINEIIDSCLVMLNSEIKDRIEIIKHYTSDLTPIPGNVSSLFQVFLNLLANAGQAIEGFGQITITTSQDDQQIKVTIGDDGLGISNENISKIMDPFFTTKPPGEGTGLGLSITYEIIQNHGGSITVKSELEKGTTFMLFFPIPR